MCVCVFFFSPIETHTALHLMIVHPKERPCHNTCATKASRNSVIDTERERVRERDGGNGMQ